MNPYRLSIFLGVLGSILLNAGEQTLDFSKLDKLPRFIQPYGSAKNQPKVTLSGEEGKKTVQAVLHRAGKGCYGGIAVYLQEHFPWEECANLRFVTAGEMDEEVDSVVCIVFDEANHVWQGTISPGFESEFVFPAEKLKYSYTEGHPGIAAPKSKTGKIRLVLFAIRLKKGDPADFGFKVKQIEFSGKTKPSAGK